MLSDGQDDTLVEGAQGGFHVWMQYAVKGMAPATVTLERSANRVSDGAVVFVYRGDVDVGAAAAMTAGGPRRRAIPMFMCPSPIGISVVDVPIEFTLRMLDGDAELARAAITLVPRCPDAQRDLCTRICTG